MSPDRRARVELLRDRALGMSDATCRAFLDAACGADATLRAEVEAAMASAKAGAVVAAHAAAASHEPGATAAADVPADGDAGGAAEAAIPGDRADDALEGVAITVYADRHRLDLQARLRLFTDACECVQSEHDRGFIRGFLQPVLVRVVESADRALVRLASPNAVGIERLWGSPEYLSPEQLGSQGREVDTRTDVYSLGVLLYELLTGQLPFDVEALHRAGAIEAQRLVASVPPPLPSTRMGHAAPEAREAALARHSSPAALERELRGELDAIVLRAMASVREKRYRTAHALALDVQRHLAHEPVRAVESTPLYEAGKFAKRNRVLVVSLSLLGAIVAGTLAATSAALWNATRERAEAERALASAEAASLATRLELAGERLAAGRAAAAESLAERVHQHAPRVFGADDPRTHAALVLLARARSANGGEAATLWRRVLTTPGAVRGAGAVAAREALAAALERSGRLDGADSAWAEAIAARRTAGPLGADAWPALEAHARLLARLDRPAEAESLARECLRAREAAHGPHDGATAEARVLLGTLLAKQGLGRDALPVLALAVRDLAAARGADAIATIEALEALADCEATLGRRGEAERDLRRALAARVRVHGADAAPTLATSRSLAGLLRDAGRPAEASRLYERTLDALRRTRGDADPVTAAVAFEWARLWLRQRRPAAARPLLELASAAGDALPPRARLLYGTVLGGVLTDDRQFVRAESVLVATRKATTPAIPPGDSLAVLHGETLARLHERAEAANAAAAGPASSRQR